MNPRLRDHHSNAESAVSLWVNRGITQNLNAVISEKVLGGVEFFGNGETGVIPLNQARKEVTYG